MKYCICGFAISLAGAFAIFAAAAEPVPSSRSLANDASQRWNKAAAARYLDERMELWFKRAKKLKTGSDSFSCASCHTTVPYIMARPVLRKAMEEARPTAQETKLLAETIRRVETYTEHEPLYQSKVEQSLGTEAVLNLLILAGEDARQRRRGAGEPTRKAIAELWRQQRPDGAWNWLDFGLEPYESTDSLCYGAARAAMAIATVPGYIEAADAEAAERLARLREYLKRKYPGENLYNRVWVLLASTRLEGLLGHDQRDTLLKELDSKQHADGGWSLHELGPWTWSKTSPPFEPEGKPDAGLLSDSDGYATGLIAYTFHEAGVTDPPALKRAMVWLVAHQRECQVEQTNWTCWRAYSLNCDREHGSDEGEPWRRMFMSDAATAFAALALLSSESPNHVSAWHGD